MSETIELRLVNLAQKVADMYCDRIPREQYEQLCSAINVCKAYHTENQDDWGVMYDVVQGEDGIWNYACYKNIEEEISDMWALVTDILTCNCWLACVEKREPLPQDMEIEGENIPGFVELLESSIGDNDKIDYDTIFQYWGKNLCYL